MTLIYLPDFRLRMVSEPANMNEAQEIIDKLVETLGTIPGAGLAAVQIGILKRIFITAIGEYKFYINPTIIRFSEEKEIAYEGCLSIREARELVERSTEIDISYTDENGNPQTNTYNGFEARCIQHEMDHLNGVLFIDYLSKLKRDRIIKRNIKLSGFLSD